MSLNFPKGFLWGAATSSHQVEGGNDNDWSEWEKSQKRIESLKNQGLNPDDFISGQACDSYNRYEEDLDIAKDLGHNCHRLSIEWSRIEPSQGQFNQNEIDHYVRVIRAVRDRGMVPVVTLWHFTSPKWFYNIGGWSHFEAPELFIRFIKVIVPALKGNVGLWITLNEASTVYAGHSYLRGTWPPQEKSFFKFLRARRNFALAHKLAYQTIKEIYSSPNEAGLGKKSDATSHNIVDNFRDEGLVGIVENNCQVVSGTLLRLLGITWLINYFSYEIFLSKVAKHCDFIGLNYYTIKRLPGSLMTLPRQRWMVDMRWEIYPKGIYDRLLALSRLGKPIYITENGTSDEDDNMRIKFIKDHLFWVYKAISDGVNVRGYMYWSLLDNFEWAAGFKPRFGLVAIDYATLGRQVRASAREYAKIIRTNQLDTD